MRKSELDQAGPCVNLRVSAGLHEVKLTLSGRPNAIVSIILMEAKSFKLRRLTGLTAYASAGLAN